MCRCPKKHNKDTHTPIRILPIFRLGKRNGTDNQQLRSNSSTDRPCKIEDGNQSVKIKLSKLLWGLPVGLDIHKRILYYKMV